MAQEPTDEEVGMAILKIFGDFGTCPGEILQHKYISGGIEDSKYRVHDINKGLKWLLDNGHIELREGRDDTYILTESGFYLI